MAVALDATTLFSGTAVTFFTTTHTPVGTPTAAVVGHYGYSGSSSSTFSHTYGGNSMSAAFTPAAADTVIDQGQIFGLANPPSGAQTVQCNCTTTYYWICYIATFTGSDTSTCFSAANSAVNTSGSSTALSVTVSGGSSGDLVFCVGGTDPNSDMSAGGGGSNTTDLYLNTSFPGERASCSLAPGASSVTATYTAAVGVQWIMMAASVKQAGGGPAPIAISATFAGTGGLIADVVKTKSLSATFAPRGGLTASVFRAKMISATFAGAGSFTAGGNLKQRHNVTPEEFDPVGGLTASLRQRHALFAQFDGVGSLTADVTVSTPTGAIQQISAQFDGAGSLAANLSQQMAVSVTFAGIGGLIGDVSVARPVTATFAGAGGLSASLSITSPITATFAGAGSLAASLSQRMAITATFAGVGGLVGNVTPPGVQTYPISATFAGVGGLTANVLVTKPISATFAGQGSLAASLSQRMAVSVTFAGIGGLSADGLVTKPISATFAGIGGLSASLSMSMPIAGTFAGVGGLTATLVPPAPQTYSIEATFAGAGSLTTALTQRLPIVAAFAGVGSLDAALSQRLPLAATFAGVGSLTANLFIVTSGQQLINALFSGVGGLFADLELIEAPRPPFLGGIGEPPYRQLRPIYADIECKIETGQSQGANGRLQQDVVFPFRTDQEPSGIVSEAAMDIPVVAAVRQLRGQTKSAARISLQLRSATSQCHGGTLDANARLDAALFIKSGGEAPRIPEYHGEPEFFQPMRDEAWD